MTEVLVLNKTYQYLHITSLKKAMRLLCLGKAEIVEALEDGIMTVTEMFPMPSVIRLLEMVNFTRKPVAFTRRRLLVRDLFRCQYCGIKDQKMTVDHVIPQSMGGKSTWENCAAACIECNTLKANTMPDAKGIITVRTLDGKVITMKLRREPWHPSFGEYIQLSSRVLRKPQKESWLKYSFNH